MASMQASATFACYLLCDKVSACKPAVWRLSVFGNDADGSCSTHTPRGYTVICLLQEHPLERLSTVHARHAQQYGLTASVLLTYELHCVSVSQYNI